MQEKIKATERQAIPEWLTAASRRGVLSRVPTSTVAAVIQGGQRATYPAGVVIAGLEDGAWATLVLAGSVRAFVPSYEGGQITLRYLRPGDLIGTFVGMPAGLSRSLQASESVDLLHLDAARLAGLARNDAQLAWELMLEEARVARLANRSYGIRAFGSIRLRVANAILEQALAAGLVEKGTTVRGTQHDLALAAGTVREVVATALQGLKREGIIATRRGGIVILDPDRLAREADGGFGLGPPD
ncbi:MAG TPA: Crp/Fnr family transcriptional regulator [Candidatus Limnocylindrales bacterium]|nr:Crp/Fnr family transcriptional regulator [Candidatus Limnocylindrales bacterium]